MDEPGTFLPPALARMVLTQSKPADLAAEITTLLRVGRRRVTLGLGPEVDVPLLPDELVRADVAVGDRSLVVAVIRVDVEGYAVERPATNFGVYVRKDSVWRSVPQLGDVKGLPAGTELGLGSTPAEALKLTLPDGPWIVPVQARGPRHAAVASPTPSVPPPPKQPSAPPPRVTPPTLGPRSGWPSSSASPSSAERVRSRFAERVRRPPAPSREYEPRFAVALRHWRYAMLTFGGDPSAVLHLEDPALARLRAAIGRNLDEPDRGYDLFVKDPDPDLWIAGPGELPRPLRRGEVLRIRGAGQTLGFAHYAVTLPPPGPITPRFGPGAAPTEQDIASVFELTSAELRDEDRVKSRHRELARRFHPDRTGNDPGPTSRFVELQQAWEAWRARV